MHLCKRSQQAFVHACLTWSQNCIHKASTGPRAEVPPVTFLCHNRSLRASVAKAALHVEGHTSMKMPSMPTATQARATAGMRSRRPPLATAPPCTRRGLFFIELFT